MKRGDVVRDRAEFLALPVGSVVSNVDGLTWRRHDSANPDRLPDAEPEDPYPALVRSVPEAVPEWLEAARQAARDGFDPAGDWGDAARAAVAAADKARGIVNSREELDALPVGTYVAYADLGSAFGFITHEGRNVPPSFPCLVIPRD